MTNYTADTYFLLKLAEENTKALELLQKIRKEKGTLVIPTVVFTELTRKLFRLGKSAELQTILESITESEKIMQVWLDTPTARCAGELSYQFSLPTVDAIIAATAVMTEHTVVISADSDLLPLVKKGIIRMINFE